VVRPLRIWRFLRMNYSKLQCNLRARFCVRTPYSKPQLETSATFYVGTLHSLLVILRG